MFVRDKIESCICSSSKKASLFSRKTLYGRTPGAPNIACSMFHLYPSLDPFIDVLTYQISLASGRFVAYLL